MALDSRDLKLRCLDEGFELVGIADAVSPPHLEHYAAWVDKGMHAGMNYLREHLPFKQHPTQLMPNAKSVLVVGLNYAQPPQTDQNTGKIATYAWGRDYHKVIRKMLKQVSKWLALEHPEIQTLICVDSAPILERDFAQLAGLGWFGKNTCLINSQRGSFFFIGVMLLSEQFEPDVPAAGGCGTCRACIDACPTGALLLEPNAPVALLDSNRCISYLTIEHRGEFSEDQKGMLNGWLFGCDVCQTVCPFNHPREHLPLRAAQTMLSELQPRYGGLDADWLLEATDEEIKVRVAGSALTRAGAAQLRRNARALRG